MKTSTLWCLGYLFNALWQLPLLFLAAKLLVRIGRQLGPGFVHRVWVAALLLQIALPATPQLPRPFLRDQLQRFFTLFAHGTTASEGSVQISFGDAVVSGLTLPPGRWPWVLLGLTAGATAFCTARLLWHLWHIRRLRRSANAHSVSTELAGRWLQRCRQAGLPRAELALSNQMHGPITLGIMHPLVLLPVDFASQTSGEDQDAALAHECAHIQRLDFSKNLAYEIFSLPLAFHPLRHLTLSHLAESREVLCDAEAAATLEGPQAYARSLLRLAAAVLAAAPAANPHAIGLCDAHTLERRIMSLTANSAKPTLARRLALVTATLTFTLATCISATALRLGVTPQTSQPNPDPSGPRIPSGVMAGQILTHINPIYPPEAKAAGISGTVVLKATIGKDGTVQYLSALSGPHELQQSALDAVRQWIYKPYLLNGEPTDVQTTITVNYNLAP